jgi:hypothetical protein
MQGETDMASPAAGDHASTQALAAGGLTDVVAVAVGAFTPAQLLRLQRVAGNAAVGRLLARQHPQPSGLTAKAPVRPKDNVQRLSTGQITFVDAALGRARTLASQAVRGLELVAKQWAWAPAGPSNPLHRATVNALRDAFKVAPIDFGGEQLIGIHNPRPDPPWAGLPRLTANFRTIADQLALYSGARGTTATREPGLPKNTECFAYNPTDVDDRGARWTYVRQKSSPVILYPRFFTKTPDAAAAVLIHEFSHSFASDIGGQLPAGLSSYYSQSDIFYYANETSNALEPHAWMRKGLTVVPMEERLKYRISDLTSEQRLDIADSYRVFVAIQEDIMKS